MKKNALPIRRLIAIVFIAFFASAASPTAFATPLTISQLPQTPCSGGHEYEASIRQGDLISSSHQFAPPEGSSSITLDDTGFQLSLLDASKAFNLVKDEADSSVLVIHHSLATRFDMTEKIALPAKRTFTPEVPQGDSLAVAAGFGSYPSELNSESQNSLALTLVQVLRLLMPFFLLCIAGIIFMIAFLEKRKK